MTPSHVLAYVKRNPGVTCAGVAEHFGVSCDVAGATLRVLRAEGRVKSRGRTRGTRYTVRT